MEDLKDISIKGFWKNKKTGNTYRIMYDNVLNCTNGDESDVIVIYTNLEETLIFGKEKEEFLDKFEEIKDNNGEDFDK